MVFNISASIGLGVLYRYVNSCCGKSLKYFSPVTKCGSGIDESGNEVSVIATGGSVGMGSANSVSREYELNCGLGVAIDEMRLM